MAEIMKVVDAAKKIMRQSGNMHQWGEGSPSEAVISLYPSLPSVLRGI